MINKDLVEFLQNNKYEIENDNWVRVFDNFFNDFSNITVLLSFLIDECNISDEEIFLSFLKLKNETFDHLPIDIKVNADNFFEYIERDSNDKLYGKAIKSIIDGNDSIFYDFSGDSEDLDYFKDALFNGLDINNKQRLSNMGIDCSNKDEFIHSLKDNKNKSNIYTCLIKACREAEISGTYSDCYDDITEKLGDEGVTYIPGSDNVVITINYYFNFRYAIERLYEDYLNDIFTAVSMCVAEDIKIYEPYYGWYGFDTNLMNFIIDEDLYDI